MSVIRVSIDVDSGASRFRAAVRAESIEQAVGIARARYPSSEVRVHFPIDPEAFFTGDAARGPWPVRATMPEEVAG
jgi:hypothetical protein